MEKPYSGIGGTGLRSQRETQTPVATTFAHVPRPSSGKNCLSDSGDGTAGCPRAEQSGSRLTPHTKTNSKWAKGLKSSQDLTSKSATVKLISGSHDIHLCDLVRGGSSLNVPPNAQAAK